MKRLVGAHACATPPCASWRSASTGTAWFPARPKRFVAGRFATPPRRGASTATAPPCRHATAVPRRNISGAPSRRARPCRSASVNCATSWGVPDGCVAFSPFLTVRGRCASPSATLSGACRRHHQSHGGLDRSSDLGGVSLGYGARIGKRVTPLPPGRRRRSPVRAGGLDQGVSGVVSPGHYSVRQLGLAV